MAVTNGYIGLTAFREALGDLSAGNDPQYERAIEAASRQIDRWYGGHFWQELSPTPRLFRPDDTCTVWTGEFSTDTGLVVETDDDGDGTFETVWSGSDFIPEPLVRVNGHPFDRVVAVGWRKFPTGRRHDEWRHTFGVRPRVRVTARWGWPAIPAEVEQACQILAIDHFKSKDLTGGIAGFNDFGPIRIAAFNPQARALLEPFRVPVFG